MHKILASVSLVALLAACAPANPSSPSASPSAGASAAPNASQASAAPSAGAFGLRFVIDGKASENQDKAYVPTFTDSRVAITFGQVVGMIPGDYVLFLTYNLDSAKAKSGSFGKEAVLSLQALMREKLTGPTYSFRANNAAELAAATWDLKVADGKVTASFTGSVPQAGGEGTRTVEASVTEMPKDKR